MKTKVTIEEVKKEDDSFPMSEMEPGQLCVIIKDGDPIGGLVIRTVSNNFEVMNLSNFRKNGCWGKGNSVTQVKPAPKGTKVIIEAI